ncbi:uncharacterized protein LOC120254145 [Dioscorea cayenensis subsp. rotundata]|uniref:Uncharacterized protein LOC120254145 n=1 Tax=Dioscorea cayennensis subsp. rotundata TaxID=55577 RepID=A0AB40ATC2_DIOCR|nr:uncharacterized protein LOC120254145 [Dioscorea cayenensis subsp. rotundata]
MSLKGFSFFGIGASNEEKKRSSFAKSEISPSLKLQTGKEIYRPGDTITATIEIFSPKLSNEETQKEQFGYAFASLLVDNLTFEVKGIEKLDTQWFATPKPPPGSKRNRGEHVFLDCSTPSMVSKAIVSSGSTKTYIVRAELPKVLPPSYRGTTIRYTYYVKTTLRGRWLMLENGQHSRESADGQVQLEARAPLQIWVTQKTYNLLSEGGLSVATDQMDIYWKEKDSDSEWTRANEIVEGFEEGYDSSRDEISSVSSYNPTKGNLDLSFRSSLSLQSMATKASNNEALYSQGARTSSSYIPISQLLVAEVIDDPGAGFVSPQEKINVSTSALSPSVPWKSGSPFANDDGGAPSAAKSAESAASEGFIRGRSYNIRIDDQVLLRFSPKNSDSTYYFGDLIGGTLTFFHGEGPRRCLEVSITLETSETINQRFAHPSRRSSLTTTKVQSDHHEVVSDLMQTSFLFSIPIDGPMSFSTPYISVQWALRFEFFTTPKHLDISRYEHPLLVEDREKGDWVLPLTVYAPPPRTQPANSNNEKPSSLGNMWIHT